MDIQELVQINEMLEIIFNDEKNERLDSIDTLEYFENIRILYDKHKREPKDKNKKIDKDLDILYDKLLNNKRFPFVIKLIIKKIINISYRLTEWTELQETIETDVGKNDDNLDSLDTLEYCENIKCLCDKLRLEPNNKNFDNLYDKLINNEHFIFVVGELIIKRLDEKKVKLNTGPFPTLPSFGR